MSLPDLDGLSPHALEDALGARLESLRSEVRRDPLSNPVRQLAHELSRALEGGKLDRAKLTALLGLLDKDAFANRAEHVRRYLQLDQEEDLAGVVRSLSDPLPDFAAFEAFWSRRRETIVFTGHPTFLLRPEARERLAACAAEGAVPSEGPGMPDDDITLGEEHRQAEHAMRTAGDALGRLTRALLTYARDRFPGEWRGFSPTPIGLGTWVGYDMDGRNDIGWQAVIAHRLEEKRDRLGIYLARLEEIDFEPASALRDKLADAHARASRDADAFGVPLTDPADLAAAANALTADGDDRLTSVKPIMRELAQLADRADPDAAVRLLALRSEMELFGLGMGDIHFRLNAAQIRNAARTALGFNREDDLFGRSALEEVSALIARTEPVRVNFASLAAETSSAARLFIATSQILKHVDEDAPVRLLIAECENPVTVLTAIYLAKLFGTDHKIDVCPLFETAISLDRGRRILDVLFQQEAYRTQAKRRGRVSIETGFSDAGRFMGQVPAGLAIERLQGQLADEMHRHGLGDLEAVIYDTHGESMGRGGHPGGILDRCLYACSPWARAQFAERGINLVHEQSFQGGDGYVWFTDDLLAERTLGGILRAHALAAEASPANDPFYRDTAASLDFFNAVKRRQEDLFSDPAYNVALGAMGLALLPKTGSRKSRRQFDRGADEETSLRRIRAIPHNGILQQMGFLANILGGVGSAVGIEPEAYARLCSKSDRMGRIMRLVATANSHSEMKTMIAYMKLYDGSFWATRPLSGEEEALEAPCAVLAGALSDDPRYFAALQLAGRLRSDSIALTRALTAMDLPAKSYPPVHLDILHAVRLCLIQHAFLIAARLPAFTPQGGFSREDVMALIFALDVPQAVATLRETFPMGADPTQQAQLDEPADYPAEATPRYQAIERDFIRPLEETYEMILRVSVGVANHFAALG
ncbi:phosphoenolpyruvate carboxylase [Parvularcula dongshanensis]|uniref:Phosphoenolpyruvate carboxylase n=1 Tax=Parvularcula dongshanensis TaxID=1173995 RepID=A0A840I2X8_9PROT|nr:phosphoenolpyruvate carboxylase [Parvularcula dongshanensis]MBB4658685.1 phosphoenolpyruvate carboxylase [Parvularcula dongshanensis]